MSWHTNSKNSFLSVVKILTNTVILFSNRHMHLKNCSKGFNGTSGLWHWKSVGKVLQNHVVCEILTNLLNQNASITIPYNVSWRKRLLLFETLSYKTLTPRRDYGGCLRDSLQALKISNAQNTTRDMNVVTEYGVVVRRRNYIA